MDDERRCVPARAARAACAGLAPPKLCSAFGLRASGRGATGDGVSPVLGTDGRMRWERKRTWMGRSSRGFWRAAAFGSMAAVPTSSGCGDDSETCLAYACSTTVGLVAELPCAEASATFDVTLCHGDECSTGVVAWSRGNAQACTEDLAPEPTPAGFDDRRIVCVTAREQVVVFSGTWDFGNEGRPAGNTFRLQVADGASGNVLIDEAANGEFDPGPSYDHCHACYQATIDLGTSPGECSAS